MAGKIHELRAKLSKLTSEANTLEDAVVAAVAGGDETTIAAARTTLAAKDAERAGVLAEVETEQRKNDRLAEAGATIPHVEVGAPRADADPKRGFAGHRDFFLAAIDNSGLKDRAAIEDERLQPLAVMDRDDKVAAGELAFLLPSAFTPRAAVGSDEQGAYSDTYGGFAVPVTRASGLLQVGFEGDPTAGLTMNVPMASPTVEILARTDKDHTTSVSGGFTVARRAETAAMTASRAALELITLKASGLFGLAYATEEILTDSAISFAAMIDAGFRSQFGAHILNEKIRGLGGNEYLGVLNSPAKVEVSKETSQAADTIVYNNVLKMRARCWGFGQAVWLANHDTFPQLATMSLPVGTGGAPVYIPSAFGDRPDTLLGRPILYSEYPNTVGDAGDLILVNWSQYLEGTYQPIQGAESVHVRFVNHERTFKVWTRNAGAPWWRSALTVAKGSNTLSPIVTLAARA